MKVKSFSVAGEKLRQRANRPDTPPAVREDLLRQAVAQEKNDVFGVGHKTDRNGKPIEQGIGTAGNQTSHSIDAYILAQTVWRKGGPEPGYEQHLARMKRELAECEARRAKEETED
jgi:hypothetical protein